MIWEIKIYLIASLYLCGAIFIIIFPPRNYELSGARVRMGRNASGKQQYLRYVDYEKLLEAAKRLGREDPELVRVLHLSPKTSEGRSVVAFELHSDKHSKKPGVLIIGALNAMAWGAPNAILELSERLLHDTDYQTPFFNDYDWYLIPAANPDGLYFTQNLRSRPPVDSKRWLLNATLRSQTRPIEWHKNLDKELEYEQCFGTNINRNFAYHWQDDVHKTPEICSQYYPGHKPFSSPEAQAIRTYIDSLGTSIDLAVHLHTSFEPRKECILYPWRYSLRQPSNYRTLQCIGEYAARNARLPDGRLYEVHQSSNDGRVAGSLTDYISGVVGTELVFLLKPYHQMFPNYSDIESLETYISKSISALLGLVRGWRSSTKQNTLTFFGKYIEF